MKPRLHAASIALSALLIGACHADGRDTGATAPAPEPPSTRIEQGTGATGTGGATGSVRGAGPAMPAPAGPAPRSERGNTPPGVDRDGHGPAAGAIVDPTGAASGTIRH